MRKSILLVYDGKMTSLPPAMTILDVLLSDGGYDITIISSEEDNEFDNLYSDKDIIIKHYYNRRFYKNIIKKVYFRLKRDIIFKRKLKEDLNNIHYDILWIIHELTAIKAKSLIKNKKYILSTYELRDDHIHQLKESKSLTQNALVNVVCEYNRGQIMRTWFGLKENPIVLPNKNYSHPRTRNIPTSYVPSNKTEKIVLYQGIISEERNLDVLCKAIASMDGYQLVLMGNKGVYLDKLLSISPNIKHIDYIKAPFHLDVTSNAYIGVVTYDYVCLNTIFCAPNKIWEYAGFGIPILGRDIPGLMNTIGQAGAGVCTDTNNIAAIQEAITDIDTHYREYSNNATIFFESCDVQQIINKILDKYIEKLALE